MIAKKRKKFNQRINFIEPADDVMTDRAGLALILRYIESTSIYSLFSRYFGNLKKNKKGVSVIDIIKQILSFFIDGTYFSLVRFDELKTDLGYAAIIEEKIENMCSSHTIKRFFSTFHYYLMGSFRHILRKLFIWRLKIEKPDVIILGMDTMVMNNEEANKREGVSVAYNGHRGFQPLQLSWGRYLIDSVFRGGSKHGNCGETAKNMIKKAVETIRMYYDKNALIVVRFDAGFFDGSLFKYLDEELKVGFIGGGKFYEDIKEYIVNIADEYEYKVYKGKENIWEYFEFEDRRSSWKEGQDYRVIYTRVMMEGKQMLFEFARKDNIIYTNLGINKEISDKFNNAGKEEYLKAEKIIELYHQRGRDEVVNEALKNFGNERLPFKRFFSNAAYYYFMVISYNLFEAFKVDVAAGIIDVNSYAMTVRRRFIDISGKIIRKSGKIILKVSRCIYERLNIGLLWLKANEAITINIS